MLFKMLILANVHFEIQMMKLHFPIDIKMKFNNSDDIAKLYASIVLIQ